MSFDSDRCWQAFGAGDPRFDGGVLRRKDDGDLLPAKLPRPYPQARGSPLLLHRRRGAERRLSGLQAMPSGCDAGVADGVRGLARRLGYAERHVHRRLVSVVGVGPLALARAQTARILLETTAVSITDVAFGAGFRSVRQFNATVREIFAMTPGELRLGARRHRAERGAVVLLPPYRAPLDGDALIAYLGRRAALGVEEVFEGAYRRSLRLPRGAGAVELRPGDGHVRARFWLVDLRDLGAAVQRCRTLLDLDSDPQAVAEMLGGAVTLAGRLVAAHGEPLDRPLGTVTHLFPSAQRLAALDPASLAMPRARSHALLVMAGALAGGELTLDGGADRDRARAQLLALPGIGPWTAAYVAMRVLRDPDAFLPTDLGVRHALQALGHDGHPAAVQRLAERRRPYRAYAVAHLWAPLASGRSATARVTPARRPGRIAA